MTRKDTVSEYNRQSKQSLDSLPPSKVDGWAMVEIARRLEEARKNPENKDELRNALRLNWRIWTIVQAELTEEHCELPQEVKINLFSLSNFIDKQTIKALSDLDVSALDGLIKINRQIGSGLMGDPGPGLEGKKPPKLQLDPEESKQQSPKVPDGVTLKELSDEDIQKISDKRSEKREKLLKEMQEKEKQAAKDSPNHKDTTV